MTTPNVTEPLRACGEMPPCLDADIEGSLRALRRAAIRARLIAQQTGTDLIVVRSGKIVRVPPPHKPTP